MCRYLYKWSQQILGLDISFLIPRPSKAWYECWAILSPPWSPVSSYHLATRPAGFCSPSCPQTHEAGHEPFVQGFLRCHQWRWHPLMPVFAFSKPVLASWCSWLILGWEVLEDAHLLCLCSYLRVPVPSRGPTYHLPKQRVKEQMCLA